MSLEMDLPASCRLRVLLYGPMEVWKRDDAGVWQLVEKEAWGKGRAARSVFKRLLVAPGRRLSRATIQDDLWPQSEHFDLMDRTIYNAINQIRRVTGKTLIKTLETSYEVADQSLIWVDSDACNHLLKEVENQGYLSVQALPLLEQACEYLERGGLLEGEDGTWVYGVRKKSEDLLRQVQLWLAENYERQGKLWQAGEQYRAQLLAEPSNETALQQWLEMLVRHGKRQEALKCYQDMKTLIEEQGSVLSPEIEQIVISLMKVSSRSAHVLSTVGEGQKKDISDQFINANAHKGKVEYLLPLANPLEDDILDRLSQALSKPLTLDKEMFQYLEVCTKQLWNNRQSAVFSSRDLYHAVNTHLQRIITLLTKSLLSTERAHLCNLLSQTSQLLGELSLDMGYYAKGRALHQAALAAAQESEDNFLAVISWGRISLACIYEKSYPDALIAIQKAQESVGKHTTPMIQGWLAAIEAEIHAHLFQTNPCLQALENAECFGDQSPSLLEDYLVHFDRSLLGGYRGVCFNLLSRSESSQSTLFLQKAQSSLKRAIDALDPHSFQRKPTLLADLAVVTIYKQDVEEACTIINQAATLATQIHLYKVIQRLVATQESLRFWKELPSVKATDAYLAFLSSEYGNHAKECFE